jgi:TM2 domain-containing membrane protein YozV
MDIQILALTKDLESDEKVQFQIAFSNESKSVGAAAVLAVVLGGVGAHKFYLGQPGLGVLYLVFCWTFIPSIIALFDACFMGKTVKKCNLAKAMEIAEGIKLMRT